MPTDTLQQLEADPQWSTFAPIQRRQIAEQWVRSQSDFGSLDSQSQQHVINTVQDRYQDTTNAAYDRLKTREGVPSGTLAKWIGTPYKWGGETCTGTDCSGFTQALLKSQGVNIPRTAREQYAAGKPVDLPVDERSGRVSPANLQPGDLVFLQGTQKGLGPGVASHVGVYHRDANGSPVIVQASSSKGQVVVTPFDQFARHNVLGARHYTTPFERLSANRALIQANIQQAASETGPGSASAAGGGPGLGMGRVAGTQKYNQSPFVPIEQNIVPGPMDTVTSSELGPAAALAQRPYTQYKTVGPAGGKTPQMTNIEPYTPVSTSLADILNSTSAGAGFEEARKNPPSKNPATRAAQSFLVRLGQIAAEFASPQNLAAGELIGPLASAGRVGKAVLKTAGVGFGAPMVVKGAREFADNPASATADILTGAGMIAAPFLGGKETPNAREVEGAATLGEQPGGTQSVGSIGSGRVEQGVQGPEIARPGEAQPIAEQPAEVSPQQAGTPEIEAYHPKSGASVRKTGQNWTYTDAGGNTYSYASRAGAIHALEDGRYGNIRSKGTLRPDIVYPEKSGQLQSTIIPGAQEFIEQDVGPALQALKEAPGEVKSSLTELFNPPNVAESSKITSQKLRENLGGMARSEEVARTTLRGMRNYFSRSLIVEPPAPGGVARMDHPAVRFVRSMEAGRPLDPDMAHLQPLADWMHDSRDAKWKEIQTAGISDAYIENYWPHLWQKPNAAVAAIRRLVSRRPFAGKESFTRKRTLPTFDDGLAKGLEPVTWNPVEQHMLNLHEMNKSLVAHRTWDYLKNQGISQFVRFRGEVPDGFAKVDDRIARAIEMRPTTKKDGTPGAPEAILRGEWYLPKPAASILNNYLSPGLRGNYIYDAMMGAGNLLNQAQLGLSAFHLTFVGHDAAASHTAVGIQALLEGRLKTAAKGLGQGLSGYAAPKSLVRGHILAKAYRDPMLDMSSPLGKTVDLLQRAGARVNQAPEYTNQSYRSLVNALEKHNYPGAALRLVPATFEIAAKPVMEFAVPRLKLGVAEFMLKNEMERLGPGAIQEQVTHAAQKVWDSVDNRMGQLVYDNLFWHNYLKQGGQLVQRSLGWNLGSVRELGGAGIDTATAPKRLMLNAKDAIAGVKTVGAERTITAKMAYAVALPLQTALVGAILYRLYNGRNPQTLKDMMQPEIDGEPYQIASYMRDIMPMWNASKEGIPGITDEISRRARAKLNPIFQTVMEFASNQDYWGNPIYGDNPEAEGAAKWLVTQFTPLGLRDSPLIQSERERWRMFFGLTKAPKEKTLAERKRGEGLGMLKAAKKMKR